VEVLVDTIVPPRSHEHEADEPGPTASPSPRPGEGSEHVHLSGRTRQNKLVHLSGPASWLGSLLDVHIEHAGPYALRGALVGA
jgi:hypothetical protein